MSESGSGNLSGWKVEARSVGLAPSICGDQIFDGEWRTVHFREDATGVPIGNSYSTMWYRLTGNYSYESAQALRWWFVSQCTVGSKFTIETRLVRYEINYQYSTLRVGDGLVVHDDDIRRAMDETKQISAEEPTVDDKEYVEKVLLNEIKSNDSSD